MGSRTIGDFLGRMRSDRTFRGRMLAAGRDGFEAALREEGYAFTAAELRGHLPEVHMPHVHTGISAGTYCWGGTGARSSCGCNYPY
jgi:hypothetical protein